MNPDTFIECLKNPSRLYQLSYQELRSLVLQYPYAPNLHLLLLEKSQQENHRDREKLLERTAAYCPDRNFLFHRLRPDAPQAAPSDNWVIHEVEEVLELKDLSSIPVPLQPEVIEKENPSFEISIQAPAESRTDTIDTHDDPDDLSLDFELPVAAKPVSDANSPAPISGIEVYRVALDAAAVSESLPPFLKKQTDDIPPPEVTAPLIAKPSYPEFGAVIAAGVAAARSLRLPVPKEEEKTVDPPVVLPPPVEPATPATAPGPMRKDQFRSWQQHRQSVAATVPGLAGTTAATPPKDKEPEDEVTAIVRKSLEESNAPVSETLADLLVRQGQYEKAIKMYGRLKLIIPEKSAYFAAKIEELKKI